MNDRIPLAGRLKRYGQHLRPPKLTVSGKLKRVVGLTLEAVGCQAPVGARCMVSSQQGEPVETEVVGFSGETLYLMPTGEMHGLMQNAKVVPSQRVYEVAVGRCLLGRVLNARGEPIDGKGVLKPSAYVPLQGKTQNPMSREPIRQPLDVGIRSINALMSVGRGQRMGLFAGSGVGKSVLLGMMTRFTTADVIVVGLIGERGREVKEFIENILGDAGLARAVVVASPADDAPVLRMHGAALATRIAEHFRDQGQNVLLLMDSLTRYAQAQREIALAIGEPPATKGYPPSVFAKIPRLVERAGNAEAGGGSITAFYTVLTEGDDQNDPIADASRAILDGHIVLSRQLAEAGHYPAIDVEVSISRAMNEIASEGHQASARRFKQLYSAYQQQRDMINIGAYQPGSDPATDAAIRLMPHLNGFLQQGINERVDLATSLQALQKIRDKEAAPDRPVNAPGKPGQNTPMQRAPLQNKGRALPT